jgi:hypothetical protein
MLYVSTEQIEAAELETRSILGGRQAIGSNQARMGTPCHLLLGFTPGGNLA